MIKTFSMCHTPGLVFQTQVWLTPKPMVSALPQCSSVKKTWFLPGSVQCGQKGIYRGQTRGSEGDLGYGSGRRGTHPDKSPGDYTLS